MRQIKLLLLVAIAMIILPSNFILGVYDSATDELKSKNESGGYIKFTIEQGYFIAKDGTKSKELLSWLKYAIHKQDGTIVKEENMGTFSPEFMKKPTSEIVEITTQKVSNGSMSFITFQFNVNKSIVKMETVGDSEYVYIAGEPDKVIYNSVFAHFLKNYISK